MTCIIGIKEDNRIYMGADSQATSGWHSTSVNNPKIFIKKNILFGVSGSVRTYNLLRFKFEIPKDINTDAYYYMNTDFIDALRKCFKDNGFSKIENNEEQFTNNAILVGYRQRLFIIWESFAITEDLQNYTAIGCGRDYALGCLHGLMRFPKMNYPIEARITYALEAAEEYSAGVRSPFHILELG